MTFRISQGKVTTVYVSNNLIHITFAHVCHKGGQMYKLLMANFRRIYRIKRHENRLIFDSYSKNEKVDVLVHSAHVIAVEKVNATTKV